VIGVGGRERVGAMLGFAEVDLLRWWFLHSSLKCRGMCGGITCNWWRC